MYMSFVYDLDLYCIPWVMSNKLEKTLGNAQAWKTVKSSIDDRNLAWDGGIV